MSEELREETPAEMALRSLACWLGVGGYNATTVDAKAFEAKIRDGVEWYAKGYASATNTQARELAEHVMSMGASSRRKGCGRKLLARRVLGRI